MHKMTGDGCVNRISGLPEHNPKPNTERGKRRHNNRSGESQKMAEASWNRQRTNKMSRYQTAMNSRGDNRGN